MVKPPQQEISRPFQHLLLNRMIT